MSVHKVGFELLSGCVSHGHSPNSLDHRGPTESLEMFQSRTVQYGSQ